MRLGLTRLVAAGAAVTALGAAVPAAGDCPPGWQPAFDYDTALYPFANRCLELAPGTLHYIDESPAGAPLGTVLMLHGNPTWSFLYRDIARDLLAAGYRVVAPDYFGFGLSDKPPLETFGYRPADHADVIEAFVLALGLDGLTLVLQDWGGPIGVTVAARHPDRVRSLVLMDAFFQPIERDAPGVNHLAVDFSLRNFVNADALRASGEFPRQTGIKLALLNGPEGSAAYEAVRNAYWGPFLELPNGEPLGPDVIAPTNIFPQNLLLSRDFLATVDAALQTTLSALPLYLVWGRQDKLWGALQCDADAVPVCPEGLSCLAGEGDDYCVEPDGDFFYPQVQHLQAIWQRGRLLGTFIALDGTHFIQETHASAVVRAVQRVSAPDTRRR